MLSDKLRDYLMMRDEATLHATEETVLRFEETAKMYGPPTEAQTTHTCNLVEATTQGNFHNIPTGNYTVTAQGNYQAVPGNYDQMT